MLKLLLTTLSLKTIIARSYLSRLFRSESVSQSASTSWNDQFGSFRGSYYSLQIAKGEKKAAPK